MSDTSLPILLGTGASTGAWVLEPERTTLAFRSTSGWGLIKVKGRFTAASGEVAVSDDGAVSGRVAIDASSVSTGLKMRDKHLRSADILSAEEHPALTYTILSVSPTGNGQARVSGTLEVAGQAEPLDLDVTVTEADDAGVTVAAETEIDRSRWGVDYKRMGMTKMSTPLALTARFRRPA